MFNFLYKSYKINILNMDNTFSIKGMKLYEKVFLVLWLLGTMLVIVFALLENKLGLYGSIVLLVIALVILFFFRSRPLEQRRIVNDIIKPTAERRMKEMVALLTSFHVDVNDKKQLEELVLLAKKEEELYDIWKGFRGLFKGMTTYILLPIITIFLAEFFKNVAMTVLISRAVVLMIFCIIMVLVISAFSVNFTDFFNPDIRGLERFIRDVEDIKVFFKNQ